MRIRGIYNYTMACMSHNLHPGGGFIAEGKLGNLLLENPNSPYRSYKTGEDPHGDFIIRLYPSVEGKIKLLFSV